MKHNQAARHSASRWRAVAILTVFSALPTLAAALAAPGAAPPKWTDEQADVFFPDARKQLVGERPAARSAPAAASATAAGPGAGESSTSTSAAGDFAWSNLISADSIEAEVKLLQSQVSKTVQTPAQFQAGGYKEARRDFSEMAMLFAIIAEYDGEVRWKQSATGMRDILGRAGKNCKTNSVFNEAKQRKEDLEKLVRGEPPRLERGDPRTKWSDVSDRTPLMQRLEKGQQQAISPWTSDGGEFRKNASKLEREAEIMTAIAEVLQREGMPDSDDDTYREYATQMRDAAQTIADAVKDHSYERARKAAGEMSKACNNCHEGYRS